MPSNKNIVIASILIVGTVIYAIIFPVNIYRDGYIDVDREQIIQLRELNIQLMALNENLTQYQIDDDLREQVRQILEMEVQNGH